MASLDITTGNQVEGTQDFVYLNTTRTLRQTRVARLVTVVTEASGQRTA